MRSIAEYRKTNRAEIMCFSSVWHVIVLVMILSGLVMSLQAQEDSVVVTPRLASLVRPSDAGFDAALDSNFPGLREVKGFEDIEPLLAVLTNDPSHSAKAYVVEWKITNTDGSSSTGYLSRIIDKPALSSAVAGSLSGTSPVLQPGEVQLVSPFFHFSASGQTPAALVKANLAIAAFSARGRDPLTVQAQRAQSVQATLDGIVYDDGLFNGKDNSLLYERYQNEQLGQHDEAGSIATLLKKKPTDDQLRVALSADVLKGLAANGTDSHSLYIASRGREAQRLLSTVQSNLGRHAIETMVSMTQNAKLTSPWQSSSQ